MEKTARLLSITTVIAVFAIAITAIISFPKKYLLADDVSPPEGASANQNTVCLETNRLDGHTVELSTKEVNQFLPPGTDVYIVDCHSTDPNPETEITEATCVTEECPNLKCTTGNEESDNLLFGNTDDLDFLKTNYQFAIVRFTGPSKTEDGRIKPLPVKSDNEGKVGPVTWESVVVPTTGHSFFAVQILPPLTMEGKSPTLQLSTFYFANSSGDCASLRWDPYGRVFDSQSLEPVANVSVTLFSKENNLTKKVMLPMVKNPQTTLSDGIFNFVVPDGTYLLKPSISSHSFPNILGKLHPNYTAAYSDIYRGEDIIQKGSIEHRDIPLDPLSVPYRAPAKILEYSAILDKLNSKLLISGTASHPLSKIRALSGGIFVKQVTASNYGQFKMVLDNASLDPAADIKLDVIKTNLTLSSPQSKLEIPLFSPVYAKEAGGIIIHAIPNNLEGYAYNASGQTVPSARVSIFLLSSQKAFSQIQADKNGYFNIPSQYLPPIPFYIQVKSPSGEITNLSTVKFASLNKKFAAEKSVNYGTYRPVAKTAEEIAAEQRGAETGGNGTGPSGKTTGTPSGSETNGTIADDGTEGGTNGGLNGFSANPGDIARLKQIRTKKTILSVITVLIILAVFGLGVFYYLYQRKDAAEKSNKENPDKETSAKKELSD